MATIKDIAQLAGVSHGTVSNVLNGRGNVSMQKILQVEKAAHQLGYSMDERARWLRQRAHIRANSPRVMSLVRSRPLNEAGISPSWLISS